ncbi:asparagine synthetase A [Sphaerisporangium viridialbum]|uniref:asparagine synthetase A n=1 Tax=Sphaerisporangium viridialbum TaxID=46189 RepID=UPI003C738732
MTTQQDFRTMPTPAARATGLTADGVPGPREHLTSPRTQAVLKIQQALVAGARELLSSEGAAELFQPLIGPVTDPGARGAKQVDVDYYGHQYKLMASAILYKQTSLVAFDKVFFIAPNVRLEPLETSSTHRHLAEFHQIDVEFAGASRDDAIALAERVVRQAVRKALATQEDALRLVGRDTAKLSALVEQPFEVLTHAEVLDRLGHPHDPGTEIGWEAEELISGHAEAPFFIVDYPKGSRGFYDKEDPARPSTLMSFDLIAPEYCGEICSGGERESEYAKIVTRMRETGENPAKYGWYLDVVRQGIPGSAGFGIGLERLTRWVAGLDSVWQASAYPKLPGVVSP